MRARACVFGCVKTDACVYMRVHTCACACVDARDGVRRIHIRYDTITKRTHMELPLFFEAPSDLTAAESLALFGIGA